MSANILIVEDQSHMAGMMSDLLADAGYTTRTAANGRVALAEVQANPPDLLLLDANMPEVDGYEVATMLKSDPATATIPIIMLSALDGRAARLVGLESGAEEYLGKPVDPLELVVRVRNLLLLRERIARAAHVGVLTPAAPRRD